MRLVIDNASSSCLQSAIEALNNADIANEGGAMVSDGNQNVGVILIALLHSVEATNVVRRRGIVVRQR